MKVVLLLLSLISLLIGGDSSIGVVQASTAVLIQSLLFILTGVMIFIHS